MDPQACSGEYSVKVVADVVQQHNQHHAQHYAQHQNQGQGPVGSRSPLESLESLESAVGPMATTFRFVSEQDRQLKDAKTQVGALASCRNRFF